jgi:hypothetical protein
MKAPARLIAIVFGLILVALGAFTIVWSAKNDPINKYKAFLDHDDRYFAQISGACETFAPRLPSGLLDVTSIPVRDKSVPLILKNLRPDFIELRAKQVYVGFGQSRSSWGIIWEENDYDSARWNLVVNADGKRTFLISANVDRHKQ